MNKIIATGHHWIIVATIEMSPSTSTVPYQPTASGQPIKKQHRTPMISLMHTRYSVLPKGAKAMRDSDASAGKTGEMELRCRFDAGITM